MKLIFNSSDSRNIRLTFKSTILHEAWYYSCIQSNLYMWRWWEIYCISNKMKIIWTICNVFQSEKWIQYISYYINDTLHEFLDVFVMMYIDDILIYLNFLFEHWRHVWLVLEQLREADLQCNIQKCKFHASEVTYLDLIVFWEGIKMNSTKVEAIISWKSSQNVHNI